MRNMGIRLAGFASLLLMICAAPAIWAYGASHDVKQSLAKEAAAKADDNAQVIAPSTQTWPDLPPTTPEGFLMEDAQSSTEFIHTDDEAGLWLYLSKDLRVEIQRYTDASIPLVWYEGIISCRGEQRIFSVLSSPERPGWKKERPETIARSNRLVFALSDDYFGDRLQKGITQGIVIRGGTIISDRTYQNSAHAFPNLDTMALFQDGSLGVFESNEHTAQEYIDMGAKDVFSFGPILIRDGVINPMLEKHNRSLEPRCVFGMIEPGRYVCIVAEGRRDTSRGTGLPFLAKRMADMGVTQALNLDGGQTAALMFMGTKINATGRFGHSANIRSLSGVIAAGVSLQVPEK